MKKTALFLSFAIMTTAATAGVSNISSNGNVSGVPSQRIQCSGGSSYIVYQKNGSWYRGDIGHMGNKFDSWSVNQVADYLCK